MNDVFLRTVNLSISASWLILVVLLLRFALRRAPKWTAVLLWGIVALRLLCPVSIESALSLIPSAETIPLHIGLDTTPAIHSGISSFDAVLNTGLIGSNTPAPGASVNPLQITIGILEGLWQLGLVVMALYTAVSYLLLRRQLATAVILRDNIFQSENVESPFVLGILRPRIYLPFHMSQQDRSHVIAHEQAHIHRRDHWWKPLGFLLLTVHWFNPLMWLAYILLCRDIELACDEKVIRSLDHVQRADYSQSLLSVSVNRHKIAACPLAFGEVGVKERVKNVLNFKKPGFWVILIAIMVCIAVAVCFLTDPVSEEQDVYILEARILEIQNNAFLVEPVGESAASSASDKLYVNMENMEPSPEPQVGDILRIEYDGIVQETYPPRIVKPYRITVIQEASEPRMVNIDGILYVDTGEAIPAEIDPSAILGQLHTRVEGRPGSHCQGNFDCAGCDYAKVDDCIAVLIHHEWHRFEAAASQVSSDREILPSQSGSSHHGCQEDHHHDEHCASYAEQKSLLEIRLRELDQRLDREVKP